ncbi:hypothetical protein BT69DRAFT_372701 [Atractiella rhizophila]|nr:hypothetical protein BT69DRAFT_372701 [Atractiella rhizophila]
MREKNIRRKEELRVRNEIERLKDESGAQWTLPGFEDLWSNGELLSHNVAEVEMEDWESQIAWSKSSSSFRTAEERVKDVLSSTNPLLDVLPWENSIIWDRRLPFTPFSNLELNLNDPSLFLGLSSVDASTQQSAIAAPRVKSLRGAERETDKFNLSNDKVYEASREWAKSLAMLEKGGRYGAIRQTLGNLDIEHSYVAEKLQLPWYKARLTKAECRSFHRPALQFPLNVALNFSRCRPLKFEKGGGKRKRFRANTSMQRAGGKDGLLNKSKYLTLKDTGNFILMEYSEEYPMMMSNFGMGSMVVNYYRKTSEGDETVPQLEIGEPFVLDVNDENPFMRFGSVEGGQTVPTLYNNIIRAPLFRHTAYSTDFLVVRATHGAESRYYIREIKHLYVVGQTYPMKEVPGPNSRKVTNGFKDRLKTIALRLLKKHQTDSLKISKFMKYFPDQKEMQMRNKLKDFMEYHRKGTNQGQWRLKLGQRFDEAELSKLEGNNPEFVCLLESMQVGQRHLLDVGFSANDMDEKEGEEREGESQLSPWMLSKWFLAATQSKSMVKLYGEGDPSGRGEAFSFVKGAPNLGDHAKGARQAGNQQQLYRAEIERIWKAQFRSLSDTLEPQLIEEEETRPRAGPSRRTTSMGVGTPNSNAGTPLPYDYPSVGSREGSPERYDGGGSPNVGRGQDGTSDGKILKIRRWVDGKLIKETIRDPFVINAYKKEREEIEEGQEAETYNPTEDTEKNKTMRRRIQEQLTKMKRNQERRLLRRRQIEARESGAPIPSGRQKTKESSRKCGHCGGVGHMKTNKKCPLWAKYNLTDNVAGSSMPSPSPALATPFMSGPPLVASPPAGTPTAMSPAGMTPGSHY